MEQARKVAHLLKVLPHKQGNLRLDSQLPSKQPGAWQYKPAIPGTETMEDPRILANLETQSQRKKVEID